MLDGFGDVIYKMASNTLLSKLDAVYQIGCSLLFFVCFLLLCTPVSQLAHSSSAHLSLKCLIAKLYLLRHYGLFIALPP